MSTGVASQGSLRHRNVPGGKSPSPGPPRFDDDGLEAMAKGPAQSSKGAGSETAHYIVFSVITALAFITRFWGISHPNQVVFDEVHFGKVCPAPVPQSSWAHHAQLLTRSSLLVRVLLP